MEENPPRVNYCNYDANANTFGNYQELALQDTATQAPLPPEGSGEGTALSHVQSYST